MRHKLTFDHQACLACEAHCCRRPGIVIFSEPELIKVASALGLSIEKTAAHNGLTCFTDKDRLFYRTDHRFGCPFVNRDNLCRIHPVRPIQCDRWPFWEECTRSAEDWDRIRQDTPCPGMLPAEYVPEEETDEAQ